MEKKKWFLVPLLAMSIFICAGCGSNDTNNDGIPDNEQNSVNQDVDNNKSRNPDNNSINDNNDSLRSKNDNYNDNLNDRTTNNGNVVDDIGNGIENGVDDVIDGTEDLLDGRDANNQNTAKDRAANQ